MTVYSRRLVKTKRIILDVHLKVYIRKIMEMKAYEFFGVGGVLRNKLMDHTSSSDEEVIANEICDGVGLALKLWGGAFSTIHLPTPTIEHCIEIKKTNRQGDGSHLSNGVQHNIKKWMEWKVHI
jgi:hypothetical protein